MVGNQLSNGKKYPRKLQLVVDNATECRRPQPPFAKRRIWFATFSIRRQRNTTYLSGHHKILEDVPFENFTVVNIELEASGKERIMVQLEKQSCHTWPGRLFLVLGNFQYNKGDCLVKKGFIGYDRIDLDKILRQYPGWYRTGKFLERLHLVYNGTSVFCLDPGSAAMLPPERLGGAAKVLR
ncbi:uncharacterized protein LOC125229357 [Leguminivora glycinivorella]|uniref:uncharacterized protein LOC125229357 n=1 Tax=Leguminivora glycinivorella TaxID=1035111 RepID=UPI00200C554C|nr:uncharacterized protein LOC125229357 [Leguminivora glycinivorella]